MALQLRSLKVASGAMPFKYLQVVQEGTVQHAAQMPGL